MTSIRFFDRSALAAAILLAACGEQAAQQTAQSIAAPTEVVKQETLPDTRITSGTVRSTTVSPLSAKVMGNVTRVLVTEGQRVRAGDVLVEIDDREARAKTDQAIGSSNEADQAISGASAAVDAARANTDLENATYKRYAALRERGSVSAQEFEEVAARKTAAAAKLDEAERARQAMIARKSQARAGVVAAETFLSYSRVRSPIDGIVTARMIDPGAQATPGMPLLTVEDDSHYRVDTMVDEDMAGHVRAGDPVIIDDRLHARVTNIVPAVDAATRSALVKIDLPRDCGLRSGGFVRVAFAAGSRSGITVPATAIAHRGQLASVFIVDAQQIARMRLVTIGDPRGGRVEVLSGIDPGEKIVVQHSNELRDGARIRS
jgi:membrane fusion protein, multidrug efflux system